MVDGGVIRQISATLPPTLRHSSANALPMLPGMDKRIEIVPLVRMAKTIGVPQWWLRQEVDEGRVPGLRAGGQYLFDPELVAQALATRLRSHHHSEEDRGARGGGR